MTQQIAGDPTLVPSMLIPGVGEAKIANVLSKAIPVAKASKMGKVGKYFLDPSYIAKGADNLVQSAVVEAPDVLEGRGSVSDIAGGAMIGQSLGTGLEVAGKAIKAGGKKIIESTTKPKIGGKFDTDQLMNAKNPDGKNVVGAFSSVGGVVESVYDALDKWSKKQAKSIPEGKIDMLGKINDLKEEYYQKAFKKEITPADYEKVIGVLDEEAKRFSFGEKPQVDMYGNLIQEVPFQGVHNAKMDVGKKGRYDRSNPDKAEPIQREAYRDSYGLYSDILGGAEGNPAYKEATSAMAPLMGAKPDLERAEERIAKNNVIPLTAPFLMSAGALTADSPYGATLGALPWLMQGMRTGTGAYRLGQQLPKLSRYAIPAAIRSQNDE
jgi:hypothetical protein